MLPSTSFPILNLQASQLNIRPCQVYNTPNVSDKSDTFSNRWHHLGAKLDTLTFVCLLPTNIFNISFSSTDAFTNNMTTSYAESCDYTCTEFFTKLNLTKCSKNLFITPNSACHNLLNVYLATSISIHVTFLLKNDCIHMKLDSPPLSLHTEMHSVA